ncbi:TonB-dependent receptor [Ampullimonas aquatilis]|uniref:TonB-dependent receptor n=1 Tax=Ampullimonas aquatilis TaxID=1341549 RepID=UPI003C7549C9
MKRKNIKRCTNRVVISQSPSIKPVSNPRQSGTLLPLGAMMAACLMPMSALHAQTTETETGKTKAETTLPTINVKDQRDRTREQIGYGADKTSVGKTSQTLREIPQSVTVITEQLIRDRNADTLKEALRNVAGLTFNAGEGGRVGDNITLRGYSAVGDLYLDNIRDIAQYTRETFNYEQIDVLRGSASMLFGRGSTGGVINQVSKKPFLTDRSEANYTFGSYGYNRALLDLNHVTGENAALRINGMVTEANSFRHGVETHRWGLAPSYRFGIGTNDEFTLAYYYLKNDSTPDYGVPYLNGRPLNVPISRFYGIANKDYQREETNMITATHVHRFDKDTSLKTVIRNAYYQRDLWAVAPRLPANTISVTDATPINRQRQARGSEENTWSLQSDLNTKVEGFGLTHVILTGVELLHEESSRWNNVVTTANPATTVGNDNPYVTNLPAAYDARNKVWQASYKGNTKSAYAQDTVRIAPDWKIMAGLRYDHFSTDYDRLPTAADPNPLYSRTDKQFSKRAGVIWEPGLNSTYYLSYSSSFNPSAELYQLDQRTANTPPEKSRNIELGSKWDLFDGDLSLRSALFRSEKTNERNTDLAMADVAVLSGKRHTDGIELEAAGRITAAWEVFGAVAVMRSKIDVASGQQANTQDKIPLNTPNYTFSLWSTYRLTPHWRVGAGLEAVGNRYANNTDTNLVPYYKRVDSLVEYAYGNYSAKLNVLNLFNTRYYEGVYQGHVVPGTTRMAQLTVGVKF